MTKIKKIIFASILIIILVITLTGCSDMKEESPNADYDTGFRIIERFDNGTSIWIVYDKTTGVMYIMNYHGSVTPVINADGTPRIWSGQR